MPLEKLKIYTDIATAFVLIPFLYSLFNLKLTLKYNKWLFVYIFGALATEIFAWITYTIFDHAFNLLYLYFEIFELLTFLLILSQFSSKKLKKLYVITFSLALLLMIIDVIFRISPPYYSLGCNLSKLLLITCLVYFLLYNTKPTEKYQYTSVYAMLFFEVSTLCIFSLIDYFVNNQRYLILYTIILSISNVIYYILFTISIYQMKKFSIKEKSNND